MAQARLKSDALAAPALPPATDGTALYVHLPFCAAKCHYCDFFSVAAEGQDIDGLLESLKQEIALRAPRSPRTVFLGGGTPSLLSTAQLRNLLDRLEHHTGFRGSASEVTIECNPESLSREKARALLDLGINRFSIGFQSLDNSTLELFGRVHTAEQSFRAYEAVRAAGASNVNVDFIYATPGQTIDEWSETLERIAALGTEHLSAYNLTFEEQTPFRRWLEQGRLERHPEELELEFFHLTRARLGAAGLGAYEISNFARPGRTCEHNLNYWRNGEYVGLGPSAVSKIGFTRGGNVMSVGEYRRRMAERSHACDWTETPEPAARLGETWWLGLRLAEGVSEQEALARATERRPSETAASASSTEQPDLAQDLETSARRARETAQRMESQGWLELADGRWRLTDAGVPLADAVAREFLRLGQA